MKKTSLMHTLVTIASIIISISIVVLAALEISGRYENATEIFVPLLGLNLLCQAYTQRKSSRKITYFLIGTAIFIFICSIVIFFIK